jgi:hypothetical protein
VEETDESLNREPFLRDGSPSQPLGGASRVWMTPWELVQTRPRRVELTYPRQDTGTAMLFCKLPKAVPPLAK